jgi:hypothetical protein
MKILASAIILLFSTSAMAGDKVRVFPKCKAHLVEKTFYYGDVKSTKLTCFRNFATCLRVAVVVDEPDPDYKKRYRVSAQCVRAVPEGR